jgi:Tol biopolymer transport system component
VAERQLQQDGRVLPLTPKVFDVLRVLIENRGHLVEKERLLAEVWPDSFVEEGALSRSVSFLRKALGEDSSEPKYIETELDPDTRSEWSLVRDRSVGWIFWPVYSPDGEKIAAHWNRPRDRPPNRGIYVIDVKDRRERLLFRTSAAGTAGDSVRPVGWSADSRWIYVLEGKVLNLRGLTSPLGETTTEARILRVAVTGGDVETVMALPFEEIGGVSVMPDGRRLVCAVYYSRSDVWVVDDFDPSP